jgi:uncharacterized delta-60 repeat protein
MLFVAGTASAAVPGSPITSFGTGGSVITTFGNPTPVSSGGEAVAVAPNGDIYATGVANISGSGSSAVNQIYIARYLPNGSPDTTFGTQGVTYANAGTGTPQSTGLLNGPEPSTFLALTPSGNPVVAAVANTANPSDTQMAVLEFTASGSAPGSLNTAFNTTGIYRVNLGTSTAPGGVAVQSNGEIVLTGGVETGSTAEFFAERLTGSGAPDPAFGTNGVKELALGSSNSEGFGVVAQSNGNLAFGAVAVDASGHSEFAITRLTATGQPDASFGAGGAAYAQPSKTSTPQSIPLSIADTPDGGYALAGFAATSTSETAALARFTSSGQLDTAFGNGGTAVPSDPTMLASLGDGVIAQNDGKLLLVGVALSSGAAGTMIERFNADGTPDPGFGLNGLAVSGLSTTYEGFPLGAALTAGGNLVLTGVGEPMSAGGTASFLQEFTIDTAPIVSLAYAPSTGTVGVPMQFFAFALPDSGEAISQTSWDFGTGKFGSPTGANVSNTFTQPGTYTVRVQATDGYGLSTIASQSIAVRGPSMKVGAITVDSKGLHMKLSCKTAICLVAANLATVERLKGKTVTSLSASGHGKHTRKVTIGSAKLKVAAGTSTVVTLKLRGVGKRLLAKFHAIPARASFVLTDDHAKTLTRSVKIH